MTLTRLRVLALLARGPSHGYGYGIQKALVHRPIPTGTVYEVLIDLQRAGLIEPCAGVMTTRGRVRRMYRITSAGLDELHDVLSELLGYPKIVRCVARASGAGGDVLD